MPSFEALQNVRAFLDGQIPKLSCKKVVIQVSTKKTLVSPLIQDQSVDYVLCADQKDLRTWLLTHVNEARSPDDIDYTIRNTMVVAEVIWVKNKGAFVGKKPLVEWMFQFSATPTVKLILITTENVLNAVSWANMQIQAFRMHGNVLAVLKTSVGTSVPIRSLGKTTTAVDAYDPAEPHFETRHHYQVPEPVSGATWSEIVGPNQRFPPAHVLFMDNNFADGRYTSAGEHLLKLYISDRHGGEVSEYYYLDPLVMDLGRKLCGRSDYLRSASRREIVTAGYHALGGIYHGLRAFLISNEKFMFSFVPKVIPDIDSIDVIHHLCFSNRSCLLNFIDMFGSLPYLFSPPNDPAPVLAVEVVTVSGHLVYIAKARLPDWISCAMGQLRTHQPTQISFEGKADMQRAAEEIACASLINAVFGGAGNVRYWIEQFEALVFSRVSQKLRWLKQGLVTNAAVLHPGHLALGVRQYGESNNVLQLVSRRIDHHVSIFRMNVDHVHTGVEKLVDCLLAAVASD